MKNMRAVFFVAVVCIFCRMTGSAAFWGNISSGYTSDDNFYKDAYLSKNTGLYYSAAFNVKEKISAGLQCDASYLLVGKKNNELTWEDNLLNDIRINVLTRPSDMFNARLLAFFENKSYQDEYTKPYSYSQYKTGIEFPFYFFDFTTPKIGYSYERIIYNNFSYDSVSAGPKLELQQEFSPWTMLTLAISSMNREFDKQYLYDSIISTTVNARKDAEMNMGLALSSVINRDWNVSFGVRSDNISSNANYSIIDPAVAVTSRTLVSDYYSYAAPSLFAETVFYPFMKLRCLLGVTYQEKAYAGRSATDSSGSLLAEKRKDKRIIISTGINYRLSKPVAIKVDYSYEDSSSNDYVYTYKNSILTTGVSVYF